VAVALLDRLAVGIEMVLELVGMRAMEITRFGGPEVLDVVDLPDPQPGLGQQLFDITTAGINFVNTHHWQATSL
jgi:hypothetical protein